MNKICLFIALCTLVITAKSQRYVAGLNIENNDDYSTFSMLDTVIGGNTVYFTGENHNFRTSNYKLQLKMLKYLYKNEGVRHLFLEFGVSRGWLVNNYVQTGDSTLFKVLEDYSYDEYALLYKGLMEFNKTLPDDKKIMVHGIDIERSYSTPVKVLSMLLPNKKAPKSIELNIETLKSLSGKVDEEHNKVNDEEGEHGQGKVNYNYNYNYNYGYGYDKYNTDNTLELIIKDYDSLKSEYEAFLGDNAPLFNEIIEGVKAEIKRNDFILSSAMQSFIYREQFMYNSLLGLVKQYPGEKFYGQFGRCHTPVSAQDKWCDFYFFNSLASRLNTSEEEVLKNKVFSIGIYYPESTSFEIEATTKDQLTALFEAGTKEGLKLMMIDKTDSLFKGVNDKYRFLIVNYEGFKIEESNLSNNTYDNSTYYDNGFDYGYTFPNIEGHFGYMFLNLKNLGSVFDYYGLENLKSPQMVYGGAATLYEDWFMYGSISAHFIPKNTNKYDDSTSLSFSGIFVKGYLGFESTASEVFNITPRLGFGYGSLKFEQKFDNPLPAAGSINIFNTLPNDSFEYFNSAFLLDPSVDIRFNIRYVAIGLNAGYQIDISERKWNSTNGLLSGSPNTSLSGFYAVATLSLFYSL